MAEHKTAIPWVTEQAWVQVVASIGETFSAMGPQAANLRTMAKQIVQRYADIETVLARLCLASCPTCTDVCCRRATVWYDLPDLLLIYLDGGAFPERQIYRRPDHSCCNLMPSGCRLMRSDRPFICTWYICPDQQKVLSGLPGRDQGLALYLTINDIKTARKELKKTYVNALCS